MQIIPCDNLLLAMLKSRLGKFKESIKKEIEKELKFWCDPQELRQLNFYREIIKIPIDRVSDIYIELGLDVQILVKIF